MIAPNLLLLAMLASSGQAPSTDVEGKVLNEAGKPIANARVYVVRSERRDQRIEQTLTTGPDGGFHAKVAANTSPNNWFGVLAVGTGYGPMFQPIGGQEPMQVTLPESTTADVKIVGPDGKPAAHLEVRPQIILLKKEGQSRPAFINLPVEVQKEMAATSDGAGIAHLSGVPKNSEVLLLLEDDRYAQLGYKERVTVGSSEPTVISLRPGCTVSGKVLAADGKPAAGMVVAAQGIKNRGWGETVTAADGSFKITQLPEDSYNVALDLAPEQADQWTAVAHESVTVQPAKPSEGLEFRLTQGSLLEGTVLDSQGKPAVGAMVGVYGPAHPSSGPWVQSTVADAGGHFRLRVPAGEQRLYVMGWPSHGIGSQPVKVVKTTEGQTVTTELKVNG